MRLAKEKRAEFNDQRWMHVGGASMLEGLAREFRQLAGQEYADRRDDKARWLREWGEVFAERATKERERQDKCAEIADAPHA